MRRTSKKQWALLLLLVGLLVACGNNVIRGDEAVLVGSVQLYCSQDCRDHGSCGASQETGQDVILLGVEPAFPGVSTVAFEGLVDGAEVEIMDTKVVEGVEQQSNRQVEIRFYAVAASEGPTAGWVPGFCIAGENQ